MNCLIKTTQPIEKGICLGMSELISEGQFAEKSLVVKSPATREVGWRGLAS
ncbi:MAG: hypothetical protein ABIL04_01965 [candidate division WOR-3 bacterium]